MTGLAFFVAGVPQPQGSKQGFVAKGKSGKPRAVVVDDNKAPLKAWRAEVRARAEVALGFDGEGIAEGPVRVEVVFQFVRPKSVKRELPTVKPDLDKLLRALLDGLTEAGVYRDDSQVVRVVAGKAYADRPGAVVRVGRLADAGEGQG